MALNEYLRKDQELRTEIIDHLGAVQGIESGEEENKMDLDQHDDSDVPLHAVIEKEIGLVLSETNVGIHYVSKATVMSDGSDHLTADTTEENIWAYSGTEVES
ncbi:hypothetical protein C8J56DRAFT_1062185 [Mycena floridula]|nr:hypothetical protein C8J56DRAFT_1062185 [Mycena floridula]